MKQLKYTLFLFTALMMSACGSKTSFSSDPASDKSDASSVSSQASLCALGTVCLADGRAVKFENGVQATLAATLASQDSTGFTVFLQAPSGRSTYLKFLYSGDSLVASAEDGWRPQLCQSPSVRMDPCAKVNIDGRSENNCDSPIYWSGSVTGNTVSQEASCPN